MMFRMCLCIWLLTTVTVKGEDERNTEKTVTETSESPVIKTITYADNNEDRKYESSASGNQHRFQVTTVDFPHVSTPFIISLWIVIAGLAKIGFQVTPKLSHLCPESCLLIVIGVIIGLLLFYTGLTKVGPLTPTIFFLFLLPPIVLDAGYYMPNRMFFDNLATILLYAVIGTVWNAITIGFSLWGLGLTGLYGVQMPLLDTILFSSIISAVDPVAVLAVFEEIQVNEVLYILVFGESLLNDAVTVVLYHMCEGYADIGTENILPIDYVAGVASFFVVALGGTFVGVIWGILAAFISRFTHHVRIIEPLFIFVLAYLSYLSAELFRLSGILALTFCGMTMKNYVEENISYKSHVTAKYGMKMLASSAETIIFLFLGASTVNERHEWNTWFVIFTIIFCSVYRGLGVIIFTGIANKFRLHKIDKVEQFIMAYGGLRGAVAFALVLIISEEVIPTKDMMVTTVIAVIYFTVFVQGMTIGLLVKALNVSRSQKMRLSMNERIHIRLIDHLMAGIEDLTGHFMGNRKIRDKFRYYNNRFIRPLLTRDSKSAEPKIFETYSKLNLEDAMNMVQQNGNAINSAMNNSNPSLAMILKYYEKNANKGLDDYSYTEEYSPYNDYSIPYNTNFVNIDLGELHYSPSNKHLADAELHHILSDAMFQPPRVTRRRYSRSDVEETNPDTKFRHQLGIRMPMRYFASEGSKKKKKPRSPRPKEYSQYPSYGINPGFEFDEPVKNYKHEKGRLSLPLSSYRGDDKSNDSGPWTTFKAMKRIESNSSLDDGIIFSVPEQKEEEEENQEEKSDSRSSSPIPDAMTLPWKRDEDCSDGKCVRRQQEFPSWVLNKDYILYSSPTHTFLGNLGKNQKKSPAIFEIFSRHNKAKLERMESIRETEDKESPVQDSDRESEHSSKSCTENHRLDGDKRSERKAANKEVVLEVSNDVDEDTKL
ncbi:Na(+)/H(+) exchanger protein 2-like [Centruroides vittatus]|uniref:Na(+)/H(+) exchanger protein 2-like n=1 Tax=Centruroides vittatus TaxID=120091 RepID=UPI00350FACA7